MRQAASGTPSLCPRMVAGKLSAPIAGKMHPVPIDTQEKSWPPFDSACSASCGLLGGWQLRDTLLSLPIDTSYSGIGNDYSSISSKQLFGTIAVGRH